MPSSPPISHQDRVVFDSSAAPGSPVGAAHPDGSSSASATIQHFICSFLEEAGLADPARLARVLARSGRSETALAWSTEAQYARFGKPWMPGVDNPALDVSRRERARPSELLALTKRGGGGLGEVGTLGGTRGGGVRGAGGTSAGGMGEMGGGRSSASTSQGVMGRASAAEPGCRGGVGLTSGGGGAKWTVAQTARAADLLFDGYSTEDEHHVTAPRRMDLRGFLKALTDTDLLDNRLTHGEALQCFDAARTDPRGAQGGAGTRLDADDFRRALWSVADRRHPSLPSAPERRERLARLHLEGAPRRVSGGPADEVLSRRCAERLVSLEPLIKRAFAHYACLDVVDPKRLGWRAVRDDGRVLSQSAFLRWLRDAEVIPHLCGAKEAEAAVGAVADRARAQGLRPALSVPTVVSVLAEIAVGCEAGCAMRLADPATPPGTLRALTNVVRRLPEASRATHREALDRRGRAYSLAPRGGATGAALLAQLPPPATEDHYASRAPALHAAQAAQEAGWEMDRMHWHATGRVAALDRLARRAAERREIETLSAQTARGGPGGARGEDLLGLALPWGGTLHPAPPAAARPTAARDAANDDGREAILGALDAFERTHLGHLSRQDAARRERRRQAATGRRTTTAAAAAATAGPSGATTPQFFRPSPAMPSPPLVNTPGASSSGPSFVPPPTPAGEDSAVMRGPDGGEKDRSFGTAHRDAQRAQWAAKLGPSATAAAAYDDSRRTLLDDYGGEMGGKGGVGAEEGEIHPAAADVLPGPLLGPSVLATGLEKWGE